MQWRQVRSARSKRNSIVSKASKSQRHFKFESLEGRQLLAANLLSSATGLTNTGWYPPDTGVAVGPSAVVETVNERLGIYNKSTGALVSSQNLSSLFSGFYTGSIGEFDPQVMYDDSMGRFVIAAPVTSGTGAGPYTAYIDFAVSNTSDPTQGWTTRQIEVDQGGAVWVDNGKLGYNADALVYSGNNYGSKSGSMVLSIDKASLGNAVWTSYLTNISGFSTIPARMHGTSAGSPMYLVEANGGSSATVLKMTNVLSAAPTFKSVSLATNSYSSATIVQPGGSISFDSRCLDAEWYNNALVACWNSESGSDAAAFWIDFNTAGTNPVVAQQGTIHPASGISTSMPAIAVDSTGDIAITYIQSSSTQYASMYITGRLAGDPLNTLSAPTLVKAGNASLGGSRIGDYAGLSIDPSASNIFWAANEYGLSGVTGNWGTSLAQVQLALDSNVAAPSITTGAAASPSPVTATTTGLSVAATDSSSGSDLTYTWTASGPAGVVFSKNGTNASNSTTATFSAAGNYVFQVAVQNAGGTVTSSVNVTVNQTLTAVTISPTSISLMDGAKQQFTASARDQFNNALVSQPVFTWSANAPGGLYTAPATGSGSDSVTASAGGKTASASVTYGTVPAAPTGLSATALSATQVYLTWTDNASNENGYRVQRSSNGTSWTQIASLAANTISYTDTSARKKSTYYYRVLAFNGFGNSLPSNVQKLTTPMRDPSAAGDEDEPVLYSNPNANPHSQHDKQQTVADSVLG